MAQCVSVWMENAWAADLASASESILFLPNKAETNNSKLFLYDIGEMGEEICVSSFPHMQATCHPKTQSMAG